MKKSTLLIGLCLILAGILPDLSRAQQQAPLSFAVFEEMVSTYDMPAFNKVQQKAVDLWNKYDIDIPISCYSTDDNSYYWVIRARSFASIDTIFAKSAAFMKKVKEKEDFDSNMFRDLSTSSFSFISWRSDLSYHGEGYTGSNAENPYVEWSFCYMRQGHEAEAAEAIKKFVDFYKQNGIDYSWDFFEVALGNDVPIWIGINFSTDAIILRQTENALDKKYGAEFKKMWADFAQHVRHVEIKTGWYKPEWSVN